MPGRLQLGLFLVVACGLQATSQYVLQRWNEPRFDAVRYLNYSVNVYEHGVFGLSEPGTSGEPSPGRGNTPLYAAFLAAVHRLDATPVGQLRCFIEQAADTCTHGFGAVRAAQWVLAVASLTCIWFAGWVLTGSAVGAWAAALFALASGQLGYYANTLLTENISILLCALMTLSICKTLGGDLRWYGVLGLSVGLLVMARPEFIYLAYALITFAIVRTLTVRSAPAWREGCLLVLAVALIVAPWLVRNRIAFGDAALTQAYAGPTLAQRVAYNRMSAKELAAAFVYWFPDFGDTLAKRVFPADAYAKLDFGPASYANDGVALHGELVTKIGAREDVLKTLIVEEVVRRPVKHALVTVALAWRGIFVAKLWGVAGLAAFVFIGIKRWPPWRRLALASAPAWFMLVFYAAVSVSIPRYSVCFIPVFSLALGILAARAFKGLGATRADAR